MWCTAVRGVSLFTASPTPSVASPCSAQALASRRWVIPSLFPLLSPLTMPLSYLTYAVQIFQFLSAILNDEKDKTGIDMLFANRYEEDILLHEELDAFHRGHPQQLSLHYLLSRPTESWTQYKGHVNEAIVKEIFARGDILEDGLLPYALLCGPPGFIDEGCIPALKALGYTDDRIVKF